MGGGPARERAGPGRAGVKQQPLRMCPLRGVLVPHGEGHGKNQFSVYFWELRRHFGVIYSEYDMNMAICFITLKVHLKWL